MPATQDHEPPGDSPHEVDDDADDDTGCTRCDAPLIFLGKRNFHEGGSYILPRIFEGRTEIEMWACSECGHVEFFMPLN